MHVDDDVPYLEAKEVCYLVGPIRDFLQGNRQNAELEEIGPRRGHSRHVLLRWGRVATGGAIDPGRCPDRLYQAPIALQPAILGFPQLRGISQAGTT